MLRWAEAVHKRSVKGQPVAVLGEAEASKEFSMFWQTEVARFACCSAPCAAHAACWSSLDGGWCPPSPADLMLPLLMVQHAWQDCAA